MKAKVRRVGNSLGFILPMVEFQERDLQAGDFVEVSIKNPILAPEIKVKKKLVFSVKKGVYET